MKTLLLATLAMCLALSVFAVAQDNPNRAPQKDQAGATAQLTTISGTIKAEGDKLTWRRTRLRLSEPHQRPRSLLVERFEPHHRLRTDPSRPGWEQVGLLRFEL